MARERVLSFEHDGQVYNLSPGDFTGSDDLAVFRETGMTITEIIVGGKVTLFTVAALLWRHRVRNGEPDLTYGQVNDSMTYDAIRTVSDEPRDEGDRPKA